MNGWEWLIVVLTVVAVFAVQMLLTILLVWGERRLAAVMQTRIGPNRAGPLGLLQTLADGIKLLTKESFAPRNADKIVYELAPLLAVLPAFLGFAIIPFGPGFEVNGYRVQMQLANLDVGILWLLSTSAVAVYAAMMAGWGSKSKYPLLGGVRASAQVISYEAAMGLSIIPVVIMAGTLNTQEIVQAQSTYWWFALPLIVPFAFFFIAGVAETNRPPFDLVEAESELVAGFFTEYSGVRFMLFYLGEYINMTTVCAMAVTLFLGGWNGPGAGRHGLELFGTNLGPLLGFFWFLVKTLALVFIFIWARITVPRLRYDQLMAFGWKVLIPINLVWMMGTAFFVALYERGALNF